MPLTVVLTVDRGSQLIVSPFPFLSALSHFSIVSLRRLISYREKNGGSQWTVHYINGEVGRKVVIFEFPLNNLNVFHQMLRLLLFSSLFVVACVFTIKSDQSIDGFIDQGYDILSPFGYPDVNGRHGHHHHHGKDDGKK